MSEWAKERRSDRWKDGGNRGGGVSPPLCNYRSSAPIHRLSAVRAEQIQGNNVVENFALQNANHAAYGESREQADSAGIGADQVRTRPHTWGVPYSYLISYIMSNHTSVMIRGL